MSKEAAYIFHKYALNYKFNEHHPFNQQRLIITNELLQHAAALPALSIITPKKSDEEHLLYVHSREYVEAVKALSDPNPDEDTKKLAHRFGLYTEDTPYFPHMHEVTSTIVGGSIEAAELVMSGRVKHALHLGGGLHHAMQNKAAGFCVYNDASVAIAYIRRRYGARVLYIDTDVHHGDGVQWSFYTEPEVCTFSIHETGKYLFPGTGAVSERGDAEGFGCSINMPVEPYTEDASWLDCFNEVLLKAVAHFKPDVIVSQHGCDAHAYDPLSHVHCSMDIYLEMPKLIHQLSHQWCDGRWVAFGGGGYDIWRVVPRAWGLVWLIMTDHPILSELARNRSLRLPEAWLNKWQKLSPEPLPQTWLDDKNVWEPMPRRSEISSKNASTKQIAIQYLA